MTPRTFALLWRTVAILTALAALVALMLMPPLKAPTAPAQPVSAPTFTIPDGLIGQICAINADCTLPPCPTEDSDNCYWDATTMGNGRGHSFITVNGNTYR